MLLVPRTHEFYPRQSIRHKRTKLYPNLSVMIRTILSNHLQSNHRMMTSSNQIFPVMAGLVLFTLFYGVSGTSICPAGYICKVIDGVAIDPTQSTKCSDLKRQVMDAGYGNILDGTYCPGGEGVTFATLKNCPAGYYCEDMAEEPIECPEGYMCPRKTANFTDFLCPDCKAGATEYPFRLGVRHLIPLIVVLTFVLVSAYLYTRLLQRWQRNEDAERNEQKLGAREHAKLQKVKPILQRIDKRLGDKYIVKLNQKGELVGYDADHLFNAIDINNDGRLSFSELQKALELNSTQLQVFIKIMNEAAGGSTSSSSDEVSSKVFANSFLDTITKVANFDPTHEDARALFEEIVRDNDVSTPNEISLDLLKYSSLSLFLSDKEILKMMRLFQLKGGDEEASVFTGGRRSSIWTSASVQVPESESKRMIDATTLVVDDKPMQSPILTSTHELGDSKRAIVVTTTCTSDLVDRSKMVRSSRRTVTNATISKEDFVSRYPSIIQAMIHDDEEKLEEFDLHFENLSLHVHVNNEDRPVVNNVTGRVRSGAMTALLGGSGAGKTSLLNALCGRAYYGTVSGKMTINGQAANIDEFTDVMGFVPQDDIVFAELTVRENLIYAGKFKLPEGTPLDFIKDLAEEVIADLGLTRVADSMVGDVTRRGVSGGEKKRVNIGLELMAKPSVLFLDEPTSGLDSSSAMVVIQCLKRLVQNQGMTVCCVIHQPRKSIFEMFESLILLGVGGNLVYHGSVDTAQEYFTNMNYELPQGESVADWLIDISSGELSPNADRPLHRQMSTLQEISKVEKASLNRERLYENWSSHFQNLISVEDKRNHEETRLPSRTKRPGFLSQTWYQFTRCAILFNRNISSELQDACLIIGGTLAIVLLDGTLSLNAGHDPNIDYEYAVLTGVGRSEEANSMFERIALPSLFSHTRRGLAVSMNFVTKTSTVICVLTALSSIKALMQKRVEFFREAGSGCDINAYYLAVNIFDTIKVSFKMILAAAITVTFRNTAASPVAMGLQFILLGWIASSWGLVFPLCINPANVVMVTGFFSIFTALLLSGAPSTPVEYEAMYEFPALNVFSSFIGPPRFFTESLVINEYKTTPGQHGFTWTNTSSKFDKVSYFSGLGGNDDDVYEMSKNGWYWGVLPSIFIGLTIRTLGFILIHACNRPNRLKQSLASDLKGDFSAQIGSMLFLILFSGFAVIAIVLFS